MNVQIKYLDPRAKEFKPSYGTPGSAGVDLRAMIDKPIVVEPGETYLIGTGISIYLRDPNYEDFQQTERGTGGFGSSGIG